MIFIDFVSFSQLRLEDTSMKNDEIAENVAKVMELVQLMKEKDVMTQNLSLGCKRRLSIAEEVLCFSNCFELCSLNVNYNLSCRWCMALH